MLNPNEKFFTCIPGLTPDEHRDAFRALSKALHTIHTRNEATPQMIDALSFFTYLGDMEAYERYFLPQVPVLATRYDDYLETFPQADSEQDDPDKNRWISPGLALRFTAELREVPDDLFAFLDHFNAPGFYPWLHADGDADGVSLADALRTIAEQPHKLPKIQFREMTNRLMAILWETEVNRLSLEHPGIAEEVYEWNKSLDDQASNVEMHAALRIHHVRFEHALMEAHCWARHGVSSADYVFPTFFGLNLKTLGREAE